jgi:hypothetical protein
LLAIIKTYLEGEAALSALTAVVSPIVDVVSTGAIVVLSTVDVDVVSVIVESPSAELSPHAAKAPIANTKRSFFIVPIFVLEIIWCLYASLQKVTRYRAKKVKIFLQGLLIPNFGINKGSTSETRPAGTNLTDRIGKQRQIGCGTDL